MPSQHAHLFVSSPDWAAYKAQHPDACRLEPIPPLDAPASRAAQLIEEGAWAAEHPPSSYGYQKHTTTISTTSGFGVPAAVYLPLGPESSKPKLPVLFITHGGGFVQGTPVTEERWLLAPLLTRLGPVFAVVSLDYRLAPEHPYPVPEDDCFHALQAVAADAATILGPAADGSRIVLAGSSAGGGLVAALAQRARDTGLTSVIGAVLNVPVLCHPQFFPAEEYEYTSYEQCKDESEAQLTAAHMRELWTVYVPPRMEIEASPFLQDLAGLPPHLVIVAGQDPLRDEGLAYAEKLKDAKVEAALRIYPGVPHTFGEIWEMESAKQFQQELAEWVEGLLGRASNS